MMQARSRRSSHRCRNSHIVAGVGAWILAFIGLGCTPWGKPKEPPVASENITDFQTLYTGNCAGCHGINGQNGPGRPLNNSLYLAVIPREALQQTIENGRPGTAMPAWARSHGGPLYPKQVTALVNGIEQNWAKPVDLKGVTLPTYDATNDGGDAARGKNLFARDCSMCHGQGAPIGSVTNPAYLTLVTDQILRSSIITGRADLGMPDFRTLNLGRALSDEDITDIVAYLASLRPIAPNTESAHVQENGTGQSGPMTRGNEGSGNGPGSPRHEKNEGTKSTGSSSQRGGK